MPRHHAQNSHSSHMKNNAAGNRPATSDFSRAQATERYSGARRKRGRRRGLKVFLIAIVVIAALGCTAAFAFMARFSGSFGMSGDSALHGTLTEATSGDPFYMVLIGVDKARFTRKVRPGETLELRARLIHERAEKAIVTCAAEAYVEGELALSCEITLALR